MKEKVYEFTYPCYKVVDSKGDLSKNFAFGGIEKQKEKLQEIIKLLKNITLHIIFKIQPSKKFSKKLFLLWGKMLTPTS